MIDVNRIRERAADWLGDVGDAALRAMARRVRGRGPEPSAVAAWNRCAACEQGVDVDDGVDGSEVKCGGCGLWHVVTEYRDGSFGLSPLEEEDAATDPSAEPASVGAWPWRGLEYDACLSPARPDTWLVEALDAPDGRGYLARFYGLHAEERAREYAALMRAPLPCTPVLLVAQDRAADNGVWCDRHGGRFADAASAPADGIEMWFGQPARDLVAAWNKHAGINAKPAVVIVGQRWNCVGVDGALEVVSATGAARTGDVGLAPVGSVEVTVRARETDMLGLKEWRFLG